MYSVHRALTGHNNKGMKSLETFFPKQQLDLFDPVCDIFWWHLKFMFQPLKMDQIFRLPVKTRAQRRETGSVRDLKTAATERSFLTLHRIWFRFFNTILSIFCQEPRKQNPKRRLDCAIVLKNKGDKILTGNYISDCKELIFTVLTFTATHLIFQLYFCL